VYFKIKVFPWQTFQDRLQTTVQLKGLEWKDSEKVSCVVKMKM
jgi:hypothetical protein